jgi:putative transposase
MPWKELDVVNLRTEFALRSMDRTIVFKDLCNEYGISRKTGYKWKKRFLEEGIHGLYDLVRRPKSCPQQLPEETVCEIVRFKLLHLAWGPKKIRELYLRGYGEAPSVSSFKRVLDKAGLVKHRRKRRQHNLKRLTQMMKPQAPNDIWTVDFKGWWRIKSNRRCEPLTIRDEYSRYILAISAMESPSTRAVRREFERVFSLYGMPRIIRSDNGTPFASSQAPLGLSKLSAWWIGLGIRLDRIAPGHPEQNGGHERMHKDIRMELQGVIEGDLSHHQHAFDIWQRTFNFERPHEALNMKVPADIYRRSSLNYREVYNIEYSDDYITRKIDTSGRVGINNKHIFISSALSGWNVGLKYLSNDRMELWFDYLRIGEIDLKAEAFICSADENQSGNKSEKVLPMS